MPRKKSTIINGVMAKKRSTKHYVDNEKLYRDLCEFLPIYRAHKESTGLPLRIPESIGKDIFMIATNLSNLYNFKNCDQMTKEEMIGDAIEQCILKIGNFDEAKYKNPFAFFTQISYFQFIERIKNEERKRMTRYRVMLDQVAMGDLANNIGSSHVFDNAPIDETADMASIVKNYDDKIGLKNKAPKKVKGRKKVYDANTIDLGDFV